MKTISSVSRMSDDDLLTEVRALAAREREATARLVSALAELDARRLYLGEGCSSLFSYCTQVLHLSEHAAYGRIEAARAARRFPVVLELLADGALTLTAVCLLAPQLTSENHRDVLASARHKSKREVELLVAALRPLPPIPSSIRKLPAARTPHLVSVERCEMPPPTSRVPSLVEAPRRVVVTPLAPERYKVQVTVSRETYEKLRKVQDLMRHTVPSGDPAVIFDRALTLLLADLQKTKHAVTTRPQAARTSTSGSRHIPAATKREVSARDGGQCAFVGAQGRCSERGFLEFHHVVPLADGGETVQENLQLRCRAHNAYEAEEWFGPLIAREMATAYSSVRTGSS